MRDEQVVYVCPMCFQKYSCEHDARECCRQWKAGIPVEIAKDTFPVAAVPAHYAGAVTPWDLQRCMKTTGSLFADARRTDAIEYLFRVKDDVIEDLRKAEHCCRAAREALENLKKSNCDQQA